VLIALGDQRKLGAKSPSAEVAWLASLRSAGRRFARLPQSMRPPSHFPYLHWLDSGRARATFPSKSVAPA